MKKDKYWVGICISIFLTLEKKVITTIFFLSFSSPTFPASFELNNFKWESWQIEFDLHNFVQHIIQSNLFNLNIVLSPSQHYNIHRSLRSRCVGDFIKLFTNFFWGSLLRLKKFGVHCIDAQNIFLSVLMNVERSSTRCCHYRKT